MNLTSKRMLQFVTVCAGFCALTAAAGLGGNPDPTTTWVTDSFEAPEGTNEQGIAEYRYTLTVDGGTVTTNYLWVAQGLDESKIVSDTTSAEYVGQRPMTADKNLVLELATEGNTLTRHVIGDGSVTGQTFASANVYVDTLIKFTPSEDTPTISNDVKVAVYVNANSNLVVYHGIEGPAVTNSVFTNISISPTNWYRLTIQMIYVDPLSVCKVYLNSELLTHENALGDDDDMFLTAAAGNTLSAVAFQGTGWVDELSVANGAYASAPAGILLTLSYNDTLGTVLTNGAPVANGGTVESGTFITIDAIDWYNVTNVLGVTYAGELDKNLATGVVSSATAATAEITFGPYSTGSFAMGEGTPDAGKVAAWAIANDVSEAAVAANAADWYDEYLLNLPEANGVTNTIAITSIAVGATEATVTVVASSTAVNFETINGTLNIYTATNLATGFNAEPVAVESLTFTENQNTNTVTVPLTAGSFIKAKVE